ncbi:RNA methyltransferase, TrmH family, group 3 [Desulfofundulus kuznetsovii DSM 6115]|uniref:RNA methyltransferase, TrmH family, group 3 n=1 Tax=Desulfofundulus kuznetsovii (strain DSM 6115 / VKM B-1805 / 17) TaxID=760568 RepID=A0AAU8PAL9_DESK7|nr:RNA methyltransferase, TrmH family, group 3 [Desulfofundulus kuznetsovii DSM 6115]
MIHSKTNPHIKYLRRLARRRQREKEGHFLLEGVRLVEEALYTGWPVKMLVYTPSAGERAGALLELARERGIQILVVEEGLLNELADTETPQGVLAVVERPRYTLEEILAPGPSLLLLVDGVQDPGNLGTMIRSADAAGAGGVILFPGTVDLYNPKTIRATMGSLFHLPVVTVREREGALTRLNAAGLMLVAGVPAGGMPLPAVALTRPLALAVGNEARGLSPELLARADLLATVPMPGRAESLNVAAAASIMLYEVVRQRMGYGQDQAGFVSVHQNHYDEDSTASNRVHPGFKARPR